MKILKSKRFWVSLSMITALALSNSETIHLTKTQVGYLGMIGFTVTVILQQFFNQDKNNG